MAEAHINFAFAYDRLETVRDPELAYHTLHNGLGEISLMATTTKGMSWQHSLSFSSAEANVQFEDQSGLDIRIKSSADRILNGMHHPDDVVHIDLVTFHLDDAYHSRSIHYGIKMGERSIHCETLFDFGQRVNGMWAVHAKIEAAHLDEETDQRFGDAIQLEAVAHAQGTDPDAHAEVADLRRESPLFKEMSDFMRETVLSLAMERHLGIRRGERPVDVSEASMLLNFLRRVQMGNGLIQGAM